MKRKKKTVQNPLSLQEIQAAQLAAFQPLLSAQEFAELMVESERALPPAIRINPLKTEAGFAESLVKHYGWSLEPVPFCEAGFRVQAEEGKAVSSTLEHKTGQYYIQEAASMLPVELFDMEPDDEGLALDLAASPGGKTTHLVSRMGDKGLVLANDSSQGRIQALKVVLQHWGGTNAAVTRFPGEQFGAWFSNTFDRVLIDAPCSMQGLRTAESHEARPVTEKESRSLAARQTALLTSALAAVRPGGQVVYSTCTLLPAEDEGVVEAVLQKFGNSVQLLDAQKALPVPAPGIQTADGLIFQEDMSRVVRLWPHRYGTAGFFACLLQKSGDLGLPVSEPPSHSMEAAGFHELTMKEQQGFAAEFSAASGFALMDYLEENRRTMVRRDARLFLFPRLLLERFRSLPVQSAGMLLGEWVGEEFIPSHEWVLRFGGKCTNWLDTLDEERFLRFSAGEDLDFTGNTLDGNSSIRVIQDHQGRIAGRGRLVGDNLKNLSSRQLR